MADNFAVHGIRLRNQSITYATLTAATQATYYVSPTGNDNNPGIFALPFQTITKVREVVRTILKEVPGTRANPNPKSAI
jgi:hypothetical protein